MTVLIQLNPIIDAVIFFVVYRRKWVAQFRDIFCHGQVRKRLAKSIEFIGGDF